MNLGTLIRRLEASDAAAQVLVECVDEDGESRRPFTPGDVMSYRGYYDHLAIEPDGARRRTVAELLSELREAVGSRFEGYKGGQYEMDEHTPMWISPYGESNGWSVAEVVTSDGEVVIRAFRFAY